MQNHAVRQMDYYSYRAAIHRQFPGNVIWRSDLVDEQDPLIRGILPRYPADNASGINLEVRLAAYTHQNSDAVELMRLQSILLARISI
jgi:hypothetical protein